MATITSDTTGNWSTGATWVGGVAPVDGDLAVIANGDVVTLDTTSTIGSGSGDAVTVQSGGTLTVSGSLGSAITFTVKGDIQIDSGGTVEFGTVASPISTNTLTIDMVLTSDGQFGIMNQGTLIMQGASKTTQTTLSDAITGGATTVFDVGDGTGWESGDLLYIMTTANADQTEVEVIDSMSSNEVTLVAAPTNSHATTTACGSASTIATPIVNASRRVVVKSNNATYKTFIQNNQTTEANFNIDHVRFEDIGDNVDHKRGVCFMANSMGTLDNCHFEDGDCGIEVDTVNASYTAVNPLTFTYNSIANMDQYATYDELANTYVKFDNFLIYKTNIGVFDDSVGGQYTITNSKFYEVLSNNGNIRPASSKYTIDSCVFYRGQYAIALADVSPYWEVTNCNFYEQSSRAYNLSQNSGVRVKAENNTYDGIPSVWVIGANTGQATATDINSEYGQAVATPVVMTVTSHQTNLYNNFLFRNCAGVTSASLPTLTSLRAYFKVAIEGTDDSHIVGFPWGKYEKSTDGADDIVLITPQSNTYFASDEDIVVDRRAAVDNGDTVTVTVDVEQAVAYNGDNTTLRIYGCGVTEDTDTHDGSTGSYDTLSVSGTASRAGEVVIEIVSNGTAGTVKVKDYTLTYS